MSYADLFEGSLVLGGPSLLAVVDLLQVRLQVDHLLLEDQQKTML